MNIKELFPHLNTTHVHQEVTHVRELMAREVAMDALRWWNGKRPIKGIESNGIILVPQHIHFQELLDNNILSSHVLYSPDPKGDFIHAMRVLHANEIGKEARVQRGMFVEVHPTAVIGSEGFGFHKGEQVPHIGGVQLHSRVRIGAHSCVDRGTIGDTVIGTGTKVDNLVHIAHNVTIGRDCHIVAGAVIGGSAVLGDRVFVGINASIRNGITIGDDAVIGMGTVVTKDVPAGATVVGNPARIITPTSFA